MTHLLPWLCPILTIGMPPKTINYSTSCVVLQLCFCFGWTWEFLKHCSTSLYCFTTVVLDMVPGHRGQIHCATDHLFEVIWCSMHPSSELNSGENTSVLSSENDCKSVKTFYTATSWQTTTAQGIHSPWMFIQHTMADTTVSVQGFPQFQLMPWPQLLC